MNLTKFSIQRPIGIAMIVAFFVVLGLFSFYKIGVELLPALNTPYVTVSIAYPGANADSVEQQVVKPAENALSSVANALPLGSIGFGWVLPALAGLAGGLLLSRFSH